MTDRHPNHQIVVDALMNDATLVVSVVAELIIMLGAKLEWSLDDNFCTTEEIVRLADLVGLPAAGDQDDEALRFYSEPARALGYEADGEEL